MAPATKTLQLCYIELVTRMSTYCVTNKTINTKNYFWNVHCVVINKMHNQRGSTHNIKPAHHNINYHYLIMACSSLISYLIGLLSQHNNVPEIISVFMVFLVLL